MAGPLYHVTYYAVLPAIAEEGLVPDAGPGIRPRALGAHGAGGVFLTEPDGIAFWHERAEQWAESRSDDVAGDELVPVVVRVHADALHPSGEDLVEDEPGTRDAGADSFYHLGGIDPEFLAVYTGDRWVPIDDWGEVRVEDAVDDEGYFVPDSPLLPRLRSR